MIRGVARLTRFGVVGIAATAIHAAIFLVLVEELRVSGLAANLVGFLFAFAASYIGQSRWTFAEGSRASALPRFAASAAVGVSLNSLAAWTIVDRFGLSAYHVLPFLLVIIPAITFGIMRYWVFPARVAERPVDE